MIRIRGGCSLHETCDPTKCDARHTGGIWRVVDCCKQAEDMDVIECSICGKQMSVRCDFDEEYS